VVNVCTGRPTSIAGLARSVAAAAGRPARIGHGPARPGDIRASLGDPRAATALLGVAASVALEDGLSATLAHRAPALPLAA
jgi:UDP-glucose 4-epimerase